LQFAVCLVHSLAVIGVEEIVPKKYALIELIYQTNMLILFSNFYRRSYSPKNDIKIR
jgi:hypothetical protein